MKYTKLLLLLLFVVSCASRQTVRHRGSHQADVQLVAPVAEQGASPVAVKENKKGKAKEELTWQAKKQQALDSLCQSALFKTTQLGLYVYDLTDGQPLYAVNAAHRMRPASCQKIVTAVTALHYLKGDYQLCTDFSITGTVKAGTLEGDFIVTGGMDPMVTADELIEAARNIKQQQGINNIKGSIILDLSMREDKELGWGWCWDDDYGPLSALLLDGKDCFEKEWKKALSKVGIKVQNAKLKVQNTSPRSIYNIRHSIDNLLIPMMKESDNIYAECLFYQTAASTGKKWAGHKEAGQRTADLLQSINLDATQYKIADGSGLSLYNYASAEMLVALLAYAWRTPYIKEHLLFSLPVAGVDGTLKKRMTGTEAQGNVCAKTGTVTGISSLAGYLTASNGHKLAFAIINQGVPSSSIGRAFQDEVCKELCR